jgi:phytoene dehydrogenase-like protein
MAGSEVVVIGSGPGGSAFAALMSHAGHNVTLLERNLFPGGRCSSLTRYGFALDTGVHMFGRGPFGPFGDIDRILGRGPRWSAAVPAFTLSLSGRGKLEMCSSVTHPMSILNLLRARLKGWQNLRWPATAARALDEFGARGAFSLLKKVKDPRYPMYGELQDVSVKDFLTPLVPGDDLLRALHAQAMLTMVVPWQRASMGEFTYILTSMARAGYLCYPYGGCGAIPSSFLGALEFNGGALRLGCEAAGIEVEGGRVRGVTTREGEFIPAEIVVSSAGLRRTVDLVGREHLPSSYLDRLDGLRDSEAFITARFILDRKVTSIHTPCLLHMPDLPPGNMFDYLEDGSVPEDLFLFVTIPGKWDPHLVPPGADAVIVGVPAPSRLDCESQAKALLDGAERIALELVPELNDAVVDIERTYTSGISRLSGRPGGDCIGLAQDVGQCGVDRLSSITPLRGLFVVGADAGGRGIGTEMAADSALRLYYQLKNGLPR